MEPTSSGVQISEPACRQKGTEQEVDHRLCDRTIRPRTKSRPCNQNPCPVVWQPSNWGPCSTTCGPGVQRRSLQCVQGGTNGTQMVVQNEFCPRHKPHVEKTCILGECPRWFQGVWSACSVSCGLGLQTRAVVCRDDRGQYSEACDFTLRPDPERPCDSRTPCPRTEEPSTPPPCVTEPETTDITSVNKSDPYEPVYVIETPTPKILDVSTEMTDTTTGTEHIDGTVTTTPSPNTPATYHVGPWSMCSATCGPGHRRRPVQCKIFVDFSHTVAVLPDGECQGPRPLDLERCSVWCLATLESSSPVPHPTSTITLPSVPRIGISTLPPNPYVWKSDGFSPCAAKCLGGTQRSRIICVRRLDETEVPARMCNPATKPVIEERICNDFPCPARWNVSEFSECSASCGGGLRIRIVQCLHEVKRHGSAMISGSPHLREVGFERCRPPPPEDRQLCNVVDCPPRWKTEAWSKCSVSCGGGFQTRKLRCEMTIAHPAGNTVVLPPGKCLRPRPKASKPCNRKPCSWPKASSQLSLSKIAPTTPSTTTIITTTLEETTEPRENESAIRELNQRRVTTKASGRASVLKGSTVKVHCPHSLDHPPHPDFPAALNDTRGDQFYPHVLWFKGRRRFSNRQPDRKKSARVSVSARGALKIRKVNLGDAGIYTCLAGPFRSDLELFVRPLPPEGFPDDKITHSEEEPPLTPPEEIINTGIEKESPDDFILRNESQIETKIYSTEDRPQVLHIPVNREHFLEKETEDVKNGDKPLASDAERRKDPDFLWKVGEWSACTRTCGKDGLQIRDLRCVVQLRYNGTRTSETRAVSGALCIDRGLPRPATARTCEKDPCPEWITGPWSQCSSSNCVALNTAYQKREVKCKGGDVCKEEERPRRKRECFQPSCRSIWKIGPWSECTTTCGNRGIKTRRVECVWYGSGLPAGSNACRDLDVPPPETVIPCKGPPCDESPLCINHSSYCEVVRQTKLCRMSHFRLQCCASCNGEDVSLY